MIVVDANCFLRYLVRPATDQDRAMSESAAKLFELVGTGQETVVTSDATIAEVVFILASRRHYGVDRDEVVARLRPILQLAGCRLPNKQRCLRALDLWVQTPRISFVDALVATQALELGDPIATFDAAIARLPGVVQWTASLDEE